MGTKHAVKEKFQVFVAFIVWSVSGAGITEVNHVTRDFCCSEEKDGQHKKVCPVTRIGLMALQGFIQWFLGSDHRWQIRLQIHSGIRKEHLASVSK